jgi:hypothetical protein
MLRKGRTLLRSNGAGVAELSSWRPPVLTALEAGSDTDDICQHITSHLSVKSRESEKSGAVKDKKRLHALAPSSHFLRAEDLEAPCHAALKYSKGLLNGSGLLESSGTLDDKAAPFSIKANLVSTFHCNGQTAFITRGYHNGGAQFQKLDVIVPPPEKKRGQETGDRNVDIFDRELKKKHVSLLFAVYHLWQSDP